MTVRTDSPAVATARAHIEAWTNRDFDTARKALAPNIRVLATTTLPTMQATDLTGIDDYMAGLTAFAEAVVTGSARIIATVGDERNALITLTVDADLGAGPMTLPGARLYLLDENDKICAEHVVFFASPA